MKVCLCNFALTNSKKLYNYEKNLTSSYFDCGGSAGKS